MARAFKLTIAILFLALLGAATYGADPRYSRIYGATGSSEDRARTITSAGSGAYFVGGYTSGDDYDFWLVKTQPSGAVSWSYRYGSASADYMTSVDATADGGAIMAGYTTGYGTGNGDIDILVIKVDSAGAVQWAKTYAGDPDTGDPVGYWGDKEDWARAVIQTADGGYVVAGDTLSFGTGVQKTTPGTDGWLLRLDSAGTVLWQRVYGDWSGGYNESFTAVAEDSAGDYAVTGFARSYNVGREELWVLKIDKDDGAMIWRRVLDWNGNGKSIESTADGGFIVGGNGYESGAPYSNDLFLIKLTGAGAVSWFKEIGGTGAESGGYVTKTTDGGFALAGQTDGFGATGLDGWAVKTTSAGALQWQHTYGGAGSDLFYGAAASPDGGVALACDTNSLGYGYDYWLMRAGTDGLIAPQCTMVGSSNGTAADFTAPWHSPDPDITTSATTVIVTPVTATRTTVTPVTAEQCAVQGNALAYESHSLTDNGNSDGIADPGETLQVTVTARNSGLDTAVANAGVLSTTTPGVTISQNSSAYPDLNVGATGTNTTAYTVSVGGAVPCGTQIQFNVHFSGEDPGGVPFENDAPFQVGVGSTGAPVTLLDENFGGGIPATWSVVDGGGSTFTWRADDPCNRQLFATPYAIADTWCAGYYTFDEQLITPVLDCASSASVELAFDNSYTPYGDVADVDVRSSLTGGAWQNVARWTVADSGRRTFNLTPWAAGASDVQVRWHFYNAYYGYYWGIDNVRVTKVPVTCTPLGNLPGAFSLLSPSDGATGQGCTVNLDWEDSSDATAYDLYLGTSDPPALHTSNLVTSQAQATSLTMGQAYYWKVVAKNGSGNTASATWDFTVKSPPSVTGASTGCTFPGVVLSTQAFSTYQWARNGEDITGATGQTLTATSSGNYTVRVTDGAGCTATSAAHVLTLTDSPATPGAPGVADVAACATSGVTITWGAVAGATGYDLRVDGGTVVPDVTSGYLYSPGNTASHSYQVRAKTATCTGDWSAGTAGADVNQTPPSVGTLTMQKVGNDLFVSWTQLPDPGAADYYEVMRSLSPSGPFNVSVGTATGIVHGVILNLAAEPATAYYKVRAVKGSCIGPLD